MQNQRRKEMLESTRDERLKMSMYERLTCQVLEIRILIQAYKTQVRDIGH
jgi:hypothetical protein